MDKRFDYELEKVMDSAIMFLSKAFSESGHNSKPVILHSIRVGMTLFNLGYSKAIVLAGLLHDVLEDTDTAFTELEEAFGTCIAGTVAAVTFDPAISSKREQNEELFLRCRAFGFDALTVKCADILDNIDYFVPTPGYEELANILLEKYHRFLTLSEDMLQEEAVYMALKEKVSRADEQMKNFLKEKE